MKKVLKISLVFLVLFFNSCESKKTIKDFTNELKENNLIGKESEKAFVMIGAVDGVGYVGKDLSIEIYKFDGGSEMPSFLNHINGNFGMIIHKSNAETKTKILEVFNSL